MSLTPEQHAVRLGGITASEIASVAGLPTAYETPYAVWARKVGVAPSKGDDEREPMFIKLGNLLEPVIADLYAQETGRQLYEPGTLVDATDALRIATPDRLVVGESRNVQIKKRRNNVGWGMPGTDEIPDDLHCQVQWEMAVAGAEVTDVPVLFWGSEFRIYTVRRDDEVIASLTDIAHAFWEQYVAPRVAPPIDGSEETRAALMQAYAHTNGASLPMTPEFEALAREYMLAAEDVKHAEEAKTTAANRLRAMLAEAACVEGNAYKITCRANANGTPAWKTIAEEVARRYMSAAADPDAAKAEVASLIAANTPQGVRVLRVSQSSGPSGSKSGSRSRGSGGTPGLVL